MIGRVRLAWRVLRGAPCPCLNGAQATPPPDTEVVSIDEVRRLSRTALWSVELPEDWLVSALSEDLELLRRVAAMEMQCREVEWETPAAWLVEAHS